MRFSRARVVRMGEISGTFKSIDDFELGIPRRNEVELRGTLPERTPAKGLIFAIPGFGGDANDAYNALLRRHLASTYDMIAVTVMYHCIRSRPTAGAAINVTRESAWEYVGRMYDETPEAATAFGLRVDNLLQFMDEQRVPYSMAAVLDPPDGEYQNFGVMQAIDHIFALNELIDLGVEFDRNNILCLGSSHGGYIAHLINKLAPNTVNGIVDNSSYVKPAMTYLGQGHEAVIDSGSAGHLRCNVETRWLFHNAHTSDFFGPGRFAIRDVGNPEHMEVAAANSERRCTVRMLGSVRDNLSPAEVKARQSEHLAAAGFDATFEAIDEAEVDGVAIKNLEHGLGAALNQLFARYRDQFAPRPCTLDRFRETDVTYRCYNFDYRFRHFNSPPYFEASCERRF